MMYALLNVSFVLKVVSQVAPSPGYDLDLGKENRFNNKINEVDYLNSCVCRIILFSCTFGARVLTLIRHQFMQSGIDTASDNYSLS